MKDNIKPNDWFVAMQDNPTFSLKNFKDVGLSPDNTGFQDKNTYKNSKYVQEKFTNEEGKFDETAFNRFYTSAAESYQSFANNQYEDDLLSDVEFDPYNAIRPNESKTKEINFAIQRVANPDRLKTGVSRMGRTEAKEWTISELAQREKIFDYEKGEFKEYNPNDNTLFGNPMGFFKSLAEPLVIAQWDEEGEHIEPFSSRKVKHKKGDYKYNEDGSYFYETLGKREVYGKQFKSAFDSITTDGSKGNKYDFFDSDSLDKSVTGTVMKTAATLAPLFVPGVNVYYGGALIGAELFDILPTIYKSTLGINQDTPTLNMIQGMGRTFKNGQSEYSREHLISTENFFNLVTDVSLQWAQQRTIFKGVHKLLGTDKAAKLATQTEAIKGALTHGEKGAEMGAVIAANKLRPLLEKNNRTAANVALGYMAVLSGLDSFESAIEQGADRVEAAAVAWGTVAGMYAVDRTGIGEIFFPELKGDRETYQKAIKSVGTEITKGFETVAKQDIPRKAKLAKVFDWSKKKSSKFWTDVRGHSLGFFGKAIGEGLEEVSEELVSDLAKSTYNWAAEFGYTKKPNVKLDAWQDMAARYGMSFFGGAVGGALFQGVDIVQNSKNPAQLNQELTYLIRNGRTSEILEELDKLRQKGKLGSTNLSASKYEMSQDGSKFLWTSPSATEDSQNEAAYRMIRGYITSLDGAMNQQGLNYSDEQLLDKMVMGDTRMKALQNIVGKEGYNGHMLQDFNTLASDIIAKEGEIREASKSVTDQQVRDEQAKKKQKTEEAAVGLAPAKPEKSHESLDTLKEELAELYKKRDKFLDGSFSTYYTDQMMFAIDSSVSKFFYNGTFKDYVEYKTKKEFEDLSEVQLAGLQSEYETFKQSQSTEALKVAYSVYKNLNDKFSLKVGESGEVYEQYSKLRELVRKELIDVEATRNKLSSIEGKDINEVELWISLTDGKKSIKPVINSLYKIPEFVGFKNATEEENSLEREAVEETKLKALENISGLISQIKLIGFIDQDTRDLLLTTIGKPENSKNINNTENLLINSGYIGDFTGFPSYVAIRTLLSGLDENNINEIKSQIPEIVNSDENLVYIDMAMAYAEQLGSDVGTVEDRVESQIKDYSTWVDATLDSMKADPVFSTALKLKSETLAIKNSPVYDFIQEFATNTYGKKLPIFNIIEDENRRFEAAPTAADYVMDTNRKDEIEEALTVLNMVEAILNATSTVDLDTHNPYGHNQAMNDFLQKYFPKEELYGVVRSDLAEMMREDLYSVKRQLFFLKELSDLNAINQFTEHSKTGKAVNKLLYDVVRGNNQYAFLKSLEFEGYKLFEGIDDISTPTLDAMDSLSGVGNEVYVEADKLYDKIYDNFQNIVEQTGKTELDVYNGLFSGIKGKFDEKSLLSQKGTFLNSRTEAFEDFDVYMFLSSLIAMKKSDFNYYLRSVLSQDDINFAPLYAQEHTAQIAISMIVNPTIMGASIDNIMPKSGEYGEELLKYKNMVMVNGIGGAGKTSVVAKLIHMIGNKLQPNMNIWKVGPTTEQSKNLSQSLNAPGEEFTIETLVKRVLGDEAYGKLANDIENESETSELYKTVKYKKGSNSVNVSVATPVEYLTANLPKVVFIDEATHVNSIYAQHLSNWASINGVIIVNMGDLMQNGYSKISAGAFNVSPEEALMVRTPKLDISMRITNIQKKDNTQTAVSVLNSTTITENNIEQAGNGALASTFKSIITNNLILKYYEDDTTPINGEKIVDSITRDEVMKLIENAGEIGYVYDSESSDTYKLLSDMVRNNPALESKIKFFTSKSVQGSERKYFIIDVDYSQYKLGEANAYTATKFMKDFYTMMTRSKEGTLFINRGLSDIIPAENRILSETTSITPDPSSFIERFKEDKMNILNDTLGNYSPGLKPEDEDNQVPEVVIPPSINPVDRVIDSLDENTPTSIDRDDPIEGITVTGRKANQYNEPEVKVTPDGIDDAFLEMINAKEGDADMPMEGIRAYGWYMRYGTDTYVEDVDGTPVTKYKRNLSKPNVIDDLNVFLQTGKTYEDGSIYSAKRALVAVRNYLTYGQKFDMDFLNLLKDRGFKQYTTFQKDEQTALDIWNSGEFKIEVRKTNEAIDKAQDKNGYDAKLVEDVSFNVVYRFKVPNTEAQIKAGRTEANYLQFTVGKFTKPETWNVWLTKNQVKNTKILNTYSNYNVWYKQQIATVNKDPEGVLYYDLPTEGLKFAAATRLKQVPEGEGIKKFDLTNFERDHPNAIRSPLYIYSGSKGILDRKVKGKGIIFVTANKDLVINGEKVTPENIASMYLRLNQNKEQTTPLIRMVVVAPKGIFVGSDPTHEGYFDMSFKDLVGADNKIAEGKIKSYLSTFGSNTTAAKMLVGLWNYRAGLGRFLESLHNFSEPGKQINVNQFNAFMDTDPTLNKNEFRLLLDSTQRYGMQVRPITQKDNKNINGVYITEGQAKAQFAFLDGMLNLMSKIVQLPESEKSKRYSIGTGNTSRDEMANLMQSLLSDKSELTFSDGKNEFVHPGFDKKGAFKIISIMSAIYQAFGTSRDRGKTYTIKATAADNKTEVKVDITSLLFTLNDLMQSTPELKEKTPMTFLKSMFSMVFHGKVNPYKDSSNGGVDIRRSYASFPEGIHYTPRYKSHDKESPVADFYPAANIESQFTYNVAIENSNFEVTIDPTKLKVTDTMQADNNFTRKEEFALRMNEIASQLSGYPSTPLDIAFITQQAISNYLAEGDTQYDSILSRTIEIYNNKLANLISDGELIKDGNRIFEAQLELVNGVINFKTGANLFDTISKVNAILLPMDASGKVDSTQIKNILYNGSNNENFIITLHNENEIKGKITGKSVKIETSTILKLSLNEEQKNQILQPALEAIKVNKLDIPEVDVLLNHLLGIAPDSDLSSEEALAAKLNNVATLIEDSDEKLWEYEELDDLANFARDIILGLSTQDNLTCKY